MERICSSCGEHFQYAGSGNWVKYCPSCRKKANAQSIRRRDEQRRAARRRNAILDPGPAHRLDLDTVLRELERFNALRRAEGRGILSYGQYVAMRDRYIQISHTAAVGPDVLPAKGQIRTAGKRIKLPGRPAVRSEELYDKKDALRCRAHAAPVSDAAG